MLKVRGSSAEVETGLWGGHVASGAYQYSTDFALAQTFAYADLHYKLWFIVRSYEIVDSTNYPSTFYFICIVPYTFGGKTWIIVRHSQMCMRSTWVSRVLYGRLLLIFKIL